MWPIIGKTAAIIGDARLSGRTDQAIITERLLSLSGGDSLTIDRKNREPVTVRPFCRIMILSNELPRLSDASGALASRFIITRTRKSFLGEEDLGLESRLLSELPGILWWAIEGWKQLQAQGRFTVPASSAAAVAELDELASPVIAFVRERCTIAPGHRIDSQDLYAGWVDWCGKQGREHPGNAATFGRDLFAAFPSLEKTRPRIGGIRTWVYEGVSLGVGYEGE